MQLNLNKTDMKVEKKMADHGDADSATICVIAQFAEKFSEDELLT